MGNRIVIIETNRDLLLEDGLMAAVVADPGLIPWLGRSPWRREQQPTPGLMPGKFHGQRSLAGHSPWGRKKVRHDLAITKQKQLP